MFVSLVVNDEEGRKEQTRAEDKREEPERGLRRCLEVTTSHILNL